MHVPSDCRHPSPTRTQHRQKDVVGSFDGLRKLGYVYVRKIPCIPRVCTQGMYPRYTPKIHTQDIHEPKVGIILSLLRVVTPVLEAAIALALGVLFRLGLLRQVALAVGHHTAHVINVI